MVAVCQLAPPACLHAHPSCYHVLPVDKAAFGQSWSCHRRGVGVQDNRRVVQLLPALSVPTMVCLCLGAQREEPRSQHLSPSSRPAIASALHSCAAESWRTECVEVCVCVSVRFIVFLYLLKEKRCICGQKSLVLMPRRGLARSFQESK